MTTSKPTPSRGLGGKPITRALVATLDQCAPGADRSNLRRIVDSLIGKAIEGDLAAIREIFDRIDGKALSGPAGADTQEPRKVMFEWKSNE
jgi:ribosomal protein L17